MAAPALALLATTILFNSTVFPPTTTCVTSCEGSADLRGPLCETGCNGFAVCHGQTLYTQSCPPDQDYDVAQGLCRPTGAVQCSFTSLRVKRQALGDSINNLLRGLATNLKNEVSKLLTKSIRSLVRDGFNSIIHSLLGVCLSGNCPTPSPAPLAETQKLKELNVLAKVFKLPLKADQLLAMTGLVETEAQKASLVTILTELRNLLEDFLVRQVNTLVDAVLNALFGPTGLLPILPGQAATLMALPGQVTPTEAAIVEGVAGVLLNQGTGLSPLDQNTDISDVAPRVKNLFGLFSSPQRVKPFFLGQAVRGIFETMQGAGLASAAVLAANDVAFGLSAPAGNNTLNATVVPVPTGITPNTTPALVKPGLPFVRSILVGARTAGILSSVVMTLNDIAYGLFGGQTSNTNVTTAATTAAPLPASFTGTQRANTATAATANTATGSTTNTATAATVNIATAATANTATGATANTATAAPVNIATVATANTATAATANTATAAIANTATAATANTATAATANTATAATANTATGATANTATANMVTATSTPGGATAKECATTCQFTLFQKFFNYCGDCRYYVECIYGNRYVKPCPTDTQFDSRENRCLFRSSTCPNLN